MVWSQQIWYEWFKYLFVNFNQQLFHTKISSFRKVANIVLLLSKTPRSACHDSGNFDRLLLWNTFKFVLAGGIWTTCCNNTNQEPFRLFVEMLLDHPRTHGFTTCQLFTMRCQFSEDLNMFKDKQFHHLNCNINLHHPLNNGVDIHSISSQLLSAQTADKHSCYLACGSQF